MVTAQLVKELREMTGAGMMDCKHALQETGGDLQKAVVWLREKGIAKAAKKAGRIAAEGKCAFVEKGNRLIVFELNIETDFACKNAKFGELLEKISQALINARFTTVEEALQVKLGDATVNDAIIAATAIIGEKIALRRVIVLEKQANEAFGVYSHMQGKIVAATIVAGSDSELARDVAMHVAAMNPRYLKETDISAEALAIETQIARKELENDERNANKPEQVKEKIIAGKLKKMMKEICLVDQPFIKNTDVTVGQYVKDHQSNIERFIRLEVGEGIEKKEVDLAKEVSEALGQ